MAYRQLNVLILVARKSHSFTWLQLLHYSCQHTHISHMYLNWLIECHNTKPNRTVERFCRSRERSWKRRKWSSYLCELVKLSPLKKKAEDSRVYSYKILRACPVWIDSTGRGKFLKSLLNNWIWNELVFVLELTRTDNLEI